MPCSTAASLETYKDKRLISKVSDEHAPNGGTLAFLEPGLVAIGDTATVKRAIDAQLSATSVTSNDQIMTLVSEIEQGNNAWAVGRVDALTAHANLPEQIARQIPTGEMVRRGRSHQRRRLRHGAPRGQRR